MEALLPAVKFLLYALGIYFLAGMAITVCIIIVCIAVAVLSGGSYGKRR